ncbi:MAG: inositol monophosphatase family protein [Pseudomonadota bacterium]
MHPMINIATRAANKAGDLIVRYSNRVHDLEVHSKGRNDFVTEIDRQAEREIIDTIRQTHPDHAFLGEEGGRVGDSEEFVWIIDPLDGTTNFLHGFPVFAVSLALKVRGRIEHAVVYDPLRQETFSASRGAGAVLNGRRIRVGRRKGLDGALIGTGFPYREGDDVDRYLGMFREVMTRASGIRRPGAAALDLAYVAAARLDGFWELNLQAWDIAGGALLVREAGGMVSDIDGSESYLDSGNVVAGSPKVFKELLAVVARADKAHIT